MTAPSPARSLDADLAAFWRALEGWEELSAWQWQVVANLDRAHAQIALRRQGIAGLLGWPPGAHRESGLHGDHHRPEDSRLAEMHKRYATRRKARRLRRGR